MKRFHLTRALTMGAALALPCAVSHAQPALLQNPAQPAVAFEAPAKIRLFNVSSQLMAYWLDPAHNAMPPQLQASEKNGDSWNGWTSDVDKMTRQAGNGNGPRGLKMPAGIESIVPVEPKNILLVRGTAQGIEALRTLVKEIDVPVKQVEIEAEIWEVAPAEFARLPLSFRNVSQSTEDFKDTTFGELAFAPLEDDISDVAKQLRFWVETGHARLITAPRMTAIDGLAASLHSTETRGLYLNVMEEAMIEADKSAAEDEMKGEKETAPQVKTEEKLDDNWQLGVSRVKDRAGLAALPVLHGDLIALAFQITFKNELTMGSTILRDGQTLPIRMATKSSSGWTRLALIKVRVIGREGDVRVPGTF